MIPLATVAYFHHLARKRALLRLIKERPNDSICSFANSFDPRIVDTWIIRAVHQELQAHLGYLYPNIPILAADRLLDDLRIDEEDLSLEIVPKIANRTGRSLANSEMNPLFGKVQTVADLVRFLNAQPLD